MRTHLLSALIFKFVTIRALWYYSKFPKVLNAYLCNAYSSFNIINVIPDGYKVENKLPEIFYQKCIQNI